MKKTLIIVLSLSLIGSGYFIYNSLNKEETNIKEETINKEFISYTLNGSVTDKSYEELVENNKVNGVTCQNGSTGVWSEKDKTIKLSNINIPDYCTIDFSTEELTSQFIRKILADNPIVSERTDFSVTNTANTTGTIYKTNKTEDGSDVYYYSGNTTNNWVYFGGFYWRIIRTNEDGSVKLLYSGTSHDTTEGYMTSNKEFNTSNNESRYAGYMYGGNTSLAENRKNTTSSTIKSYLDSWYQNNLLASYDKYISKSAIYCNDRSIGSGKWSNNSSSYAFDFGSKRRLYTYHNPNYKCGSNESDGLFESTQAVEDKFSVSTSAGGNGDLTYPIALMTADEVTFAGGVIAGKLSSPYTWYYTNSSGGSIIGSNLWWLMSPYNSKDTVTVFNVEGSGTGSYFLGMLSYSKVNYSSTNINVSVRGVISISPCAKVTGSGTPTDPYVIDENNSTC